MPNEIGKLTLTIAPDALKSIIESGRLLELTDRVAKEAAAHISAQIVDHVARAAVKGDLAKAGTGASVSFVFEEGDFGTLPPRPHWGVGSLDRGSFLSRVAARDAAAGGE